jgi:hypothetical protein
MVELPTHFSWKLAVWGQLSKPCIIDKLQGSSYMSWVQCCLLCPRCMPVLLPHCMCTLLLSCCKLARLVVGQVVCACVRQASSLTLSCRHPSTESPLRTSWMMLLHSLSHAVATSSLPTWCLHAVWSLRCFESLGLPGCLAELPLLCSTASAAWLLLVR